MSSEKYSVKIFHFSRRKQNSRVVNFPYISKLRQFLSLKLYKTVRWIIIKAHTISNRRAYQIDVAGSDGVVKCDKNYES